MEQSTKIQSLEDLSILLMDQREQGIRIVQCHGVFDLLHPGHIRHFAAARNMGDVLVVTITADDFVGKGPGRPAFPQGLRSESLAALSVVDFVAVVYDATALPAIEAVQPDVFVKGKEYEDAKSDPTGMIRQERDMVERCGGKMAFTDDLVFSSSNLINTFFPQHSDSVSASIQEVKAEYGADGVLEWLDRLKGLRTVVIGEAIFDLYTQCETLGKASKEPVLCLNRISTETHAGGAMAIASHCAGLGANVVLVSGMHSRDLGRQTVRDLEVRGVNAELIHLDPRPTIRKERFVDGNTQARVLELYEMDDEPLEGQALDELLKTISRACSDRDLVLVADYGHGLLHDSAVHFLTEGPYWLAVNAQTNAGNHGYNSIQRYRRADFVTLNGNEARLEARRRHLDFDSYIPELRELLQAQAILVTQGGAGLDLYLDTEEVSHSPALAPFVKDRVGAGDAVLAVTSLLARVGAPPAVIGFLGNVVGAWAVSFLGNERSLEIGSLKRQVLAALK